MSDAFSDADVAGGQSIRSELRGVLGLVVRTRSDFRYTQGR